VSPTSIRRAGLARHAAIVLTLIVLLLPFLWLLQMSFKSNDLILQFPPPLIFTPTLENYTSLWQSAFSSSFVNSLLSASFSTGLALLFGVPAAYALSKWAGRGKRALSFAIPGDAHGAADRLHYSLFSVLSLDRPARHRDRPGADLYQLQSSTGDLDDAAVLRDGAGLAGGSSIGRWRADPHGVPEDRAADGGARHRRHRDPLLPLCLERFSSSR